MRNPELNGAVRELEKCRGGAGLRTVRVGEDRDKKCSTTSFGEWRKIL